MKYLDFIPQVPHIATYVASLTLSHVNDIHIDDLVSILDCLPRLTKFYVFGVTISGAPTRSTASSPLENLSLCLVKLPNETCSLTFILDLFPHLRELELFDSLRPLSISRDLEDLSSLPRNLALRKLTISPSSSLVTYLRHRLLSCTTLVVGGIYENDIFGDVGALIHGVSPTLHNLYFRSPFREVTLPSTFYGISPHDN